MSAELRPCDCLNICGDDSAVKEGTAQPCEMYQRTLAVRSERARLKMRLVEVLAEECWSDRDCDAMIALSIPV